MSNLIRYLYNDLQTFIDYKVYSTQTSCVIRQYIIYGLFYLLYIISNKFCNDIKKYLTFTKSENPMTSVSDYIKNDRSSKTAISV